MKQKLRRLLQKWVDKLSESWIDSYGLDYNPEKRWALIVSRKINFHDGERWTSYYIEKKYKSLDSALDAYRNLLACYYPSETKRVKIAEIAYGFNGRPYIVGLEHPPVDHSYGPQQRNIGGLLKLYPVFELPKGLTEI